MSDQLKLGLAEKFLIQALGFCDPVFRPECDASDDGVIMLKDQSSSYSSLDGYAEAFRSLAKLGGKANAIDSEDIMLLGEPSLLAGVISADPAVQIIYGRNSALEFGGWEIPPAEGKKPVPPRDYRRVVTYIQIALGKILGQPIKPDGKYGDPMRKALGKFHTGAGVAKLDGGEADEGLFCGAKTIGLLVMRLRYSREDLIRLLESDREELTRRGGFFMGDASSDVHLKAQGHVASAFKWLGYMGEKTDTSTNEGRIRAIEVLQERFKDEGDPVGPNLVGPKIIGKIIDRVKAKAF